ncbi:hypothetical protein GCM10009609_16900 [Pseudonocardia aurantiaca]|uniref:Erythromycin esterase family protein n=1 Tax=Pseudonocardia aurantiaca TaxID=75290 RepID=A0ABW4FMN3_9PSEU
MPDRLFRDRRDAGRTLASLLEHYRGRDDVVVLGLPRGGVPPAYEVAKELGAPLDVFVVRKLGAPGQEELAMGALASGGVLVVNDDVVRARRITPEVIQQAAEHEGRELLRREQAYRGGRPMPDLTGKIVILVDDGIATGSSMRAAIAALRRHHPARIVVAVPAAPESTCQELAALVDEVVCATTPSPFTAVGASYWNFEQVTDEEVRSLLQEAATSASARRTERVLSDAEVIQAAAIRTEDGVPPDRALFDLVGDAELVLIGEASHGTHDFYAARVAMTRRLIEERGFCAVAAGADWPDAYRVNRYVRNRGEDADADEALRGFQRFPTWMWRNAAVLDFVGSLRERNDRGGDESAAGFYGLDLYSLHRSIDEVINYLDRVDPEAGLRARERYACFDHYGTDDGPTFGLAAAMRAGDTCEQEVLEQLQDLQRHAVEYARRDGLLAANEQFYAERNAVAVRVLPLHVQGPRPQRISVWVTGEVPETYPFAV